MLDGLKEDNECDEAQLTRKEIDKFDEDSEDALAALAAQDTNPVVNKVEFDQIRQSQRRPILDFEHEPDDRSQN